MRFTSALIIHILIKNIFYKKFLSIITTLATKGLN